METHHHDGDSAGAASWMMAMIVTLVVAAILLIALFAWAPWSDDDTDVTPGTGTEEGVDIEGDIDVNEGDTDIDSGTDGGSGEEPQPSGQ